MIMVEVTLARVLFALISDPVDDLRLQLLNCVELDRVVESKDFFLREEGEIVTVLEVKAEIWTCLWKWEVEQSIFDVDTIVILFVDD